MHLGPAEHYRREGFVDLDQVDVAQFHAGLLQHPSGGLHRTVEVVVDLGTDEGLADDPGSGLQAHSLRLVLVHPQHRCGTVGDLRRRAGGVQAAFHDRLETSQALGCGVPQTLVPAHHVALRGGLLVLVNDRSLDRRDLAVEPVLVPGPLGLLLRDQSEVVQVGAGDAAALGDSLGSGELVGHVEIPGFRPDDRAVRAGVGTQADPAHRLDPAGDADVDGARGNQSRYQVVGLLSATALAVDGRRAHLFGHSRRQPGDPGDVVGLLAELGHAAADDLLDVAAVDPGFLDQGLLDSAE